MRSYRPNIDRLETRQLMASDVSLPLVDTSLPNQPNITAFAATPTEAMTAGSSDTGQFVVSNPIVDYSSDAVVERMGSSVIIASRMRSQVMLINDSDSTSPKIAYRLSVDLGIQDLKVEGERAIIIGQTTDNHTQVIAIDLAAGKIVNRVEYPAGMFTFSHFDGDDAWVVLSRSTLPVESASGAVTAPEDNRLIHLHWLDEGLVEQSSMPVESGIWTAASNRLLMASTAWTGGTSYDMRVHLYETGPERLAELADLELKGSFGKSLVISADGLRASLVRGVGDPLIDGRTLVDLLDLSTNALTIQQTLTIDDWTEVYHHDADRVLLYGQQKRQLTWLGLSADVESSARSTAWSIPEGIEPEAGWLTLAGGRVGVPAYVFHQGPFFSADATGVLSSTDVAQLVDGRYVLVFDLNSTVVQPVRMADLQGRVFSLESGTDRIGVYGWLSDATTFTYGFIDEDWRFVKQGEVKTVDPYRDLPVIWKDRLLTVGTDLIGLYDLQHAGKTLLFEKVAANTEIGSAPTYDVRVPPQGAYLYPSYSDQVSNSDPAYRLIRLVGAPGDVEITNPYLITFKSYESSVRQPMEFDYVMFNGSTEVTGHIRVVYTDDTSTGTWVTEPNSEIIRNMTSDSQASTSIRHNLGAPLDVNEDGSITPSDVLVIVNAINHGLSAVGAIDTSGDGLLQPIDVLLVINYLNRDSQSAASIVANLTPADVDEIRALVLKEDLKQHVSTGQDRVLIGFESSEPARTYQENLTYVENVNMGIQSMETPSEVFLAQPGLREYNLGTNKSAIWRDGAVQHVETGAAVNLITVGRPRIDQDHSGRVWMLITRGSFTGDGSMGFDYGISKIDNQWTIVDTVFAFIS